MQFKKRFLWIAGCLLGVVAISGLSTPNLVAATLKQTLVELVLPSQPFFSTLGVPFNIPGARAIGPAQGTLGVTNLILTNTTDGPQRVEIFQPIMSPNAAECGGPVQGFGGPGSISMTVNLQPRQTLSLPFPAPLGFTP